MLVWFWVGIVWRRLVIWRINSCNDLNDGFSCDVYFLRMIIWVWGGNCIRICLWNLFYGVIIFCFYLFFLWKWYFIWFCFLFCCWEVWCYWFCCIFSIILIKRRRLKSNKMISSVYRREFMIGLELGRGVGIDLGVILRRR